LGLFYDKKIFSSYISMVILSDTSNSQTFSIIPRFEPTGDVTVTMYSEQQNKLTHTLTITGVYSNGYLSLSSAFSPVLVLNQNYRLEIKDGLELCWRGKVFVTNQTDLPQFTINEGVYTQPTQTDNSFIII
jgi:hypothetical protein